MSPGALHTVAIATCPVLFAACSAQDGKGAQVPADTQTGGTAASETQPGQNKAAYAGVMLPWVRGLRLVVRVSVQASMGTALQQGLLLALH